MLESSDQARPQSGHIPALDGVRGIAIILVLVYHTFLWPVRLGQAEPSHALDKAVNQVLDSGWVGVDLFFVLSGFLITRILLSVRDRPNYFRSFFSRRALRIFPLYFGFLFVLIIVLPTLPAFASDSGFDSLVDHQLAYWTYLFNVAVSLNALDYVGPYANGHFWSLAVEEQFYLVWPFAVLLLGRRIGLFCILCIVAAPLFRFGLLQGMLPELHEGLAAYTLMPARMDTLAIGGLIAVIALDPGALRRAQPWAFGAALAGALSLAVLGATQGHLYWMDEQVQVIGYSAVAITFGAFLMLIVGGVPGPLQRFCSHRTLTFFGAYSFALYIFHFQFAQVVYSQIDEHGGLFDIGGSYLPAQAAVGAGVVALSVTAAWLSWHLYERHFLKLRRYVPYARPAQTPRGAPVLVPEQP